MFEVTLSIPDSGSPFVHDDITHNASRNGPEIVIPPSGEMDVSSNPLTTIIQKQIDEIRNSVYGDSADGRSLVSILEMQFSSMRQKGVACDEVCSFLFIRNLLHAMILNTCKNLERHTFCRY